MEQKKDAVTSIMEDFIDAFDEHVFCLYFSSIGITKMGQEWGKLTVNKDHQSWIGRDLPNNPKFYARVNTLDCAQKCTKDGFFSNMVAKSLLCTMYSLWDEDYRHRIANATGHEAAYLQYPLMGDLRKIRHCIIHQKSIVPEGGFKFEVIKWQLKPGSLKITLDMFLELNGLIRGKGMTINGFDMPPKIKEHINKMTKKERKSFDSFFKNRDNRIKGIEWPELDNFLTRIGVDKNDSSSKKE